MSSEYSNERTGVDGDLKGETAGGFWRRSMRGERSGDWRWDGERKGAYRDRGVCLVRMTQVRIATANENVSIEILTWS
jgi:hypothetical protein